MDFIGARKKRLNEEQVRLLEANFDCNKNLDPEMKVHLARQLGVPPRQIAIWYQNKRARWKTQSLEIGYNALQSRLDHALLEKKQLEKQVQHLQQELHKATRDNRLVVPAVSSISSSGDDHEGGGSRSSYGGGTRLVDELSCPWVDNGDLMYACIFMDGQGGDSDLSCQNENNIWKIM